MRRLLYTAFLCICLAGCEKDEPEGEPMGCMTGIPQGQNYRVLIRCCTRREFLAGDNVNAGGTSNWTHYTRHEWVKVKKCGDC